MKANSFFRWAALGFLVFIGWVIYAADSNTFPYYVRDLYRFPNGDLLGHFVLYGILTFLCARAFPRRRKVGPWRPALSSLWIIGLAVAEELSQFAFSHRTPSLLDLSCGLLGILIADWLAKSR